MTTVKIVTFPNWKKTLGVKTIYRKNFFKPVLPVDLSMTSGVQTKLICKRFERMTVPMLLSEQS